MDEIAFFDGIINTNWIIGHPAVNNFVFQGCFFETIRSLLLTEGAKTDLIFEFKSLPQDISIEASAFDGIQVKQISFDDCWINYFDSNFLLNSQNTIEVIRMHRYPSTLDINVMLNAAEKWPRLKFFGINSWKSFNKTITAENFTTLSVIEHLNIAHFSVVNIELGAFDTIANTLKSLCLAYNLIKTLSPEVFNKLVRKPTMTISLNENPLICNCQLLEITSLPIWIAIGSNRTILSPPIDCTRANITNAWPAANECTERVQIIHLLKLCFGGKRKVEKYIYSKFSLRIDQRRGRLVIKTNVQDTYRIWYHAIESYNTNKRNIHGNLTCNITLLTNSYGCSIIAKNSTNITLEAILLQNVSTIFICIDYVHTEYFMMFWPLHCILYNQNTNKLDNGLSPPNYSFMLTIAIVIAIVGISLGFIGHIVTYAWVHKCGKNSDETDNITKADGPKGNEFF